MTEQFWLESKGSVYRLYPDVDDVELKEYGRYQLVF